MGRLLVWIGLGALCISFGVYTVLGPFERPEIIVSATISVLGTTVAALAAYALWQVQHKADAEKAEEGRKARQRRLLIALRAELFESLEGQFAQFDPQKVSDVRHSMVEQLENSGRNEHSMPVAVVKRESDVFDNIKSEIADLPETTIGPVIRYYKLEKYVAETLIAFSEGKFENLSKERRRKTIESFLTIGQSATKAALDAYRAVDAVIQEKAIEETHTTRNEVRVGEIGIALLPLEESKSDV